MEEDEKLKWLVPTDPDPVHELLLLSDLASATLASPPPFRRIETTRERVGKGCVHALALGNVLVASFTFTEEPPFAAPEKIFDPSARSAYLSRLSIRDPADAAAQLLSMRCLRRVIDLAQEGNYEVLRSEANPDLVRSCALLGMFGMERRGDILVDAEGRRRVYLERRFHTVRDPRTCA